MTANIALKVPVVVEPNDAAPALQLGMRHLAERGWEAALAAFDAATRADPDLAAAWFHRSQALRELSRGAEALASLAVCLRLAPRAAEAWLNKGNLLAERGDLIGAVAAYERSSASNPALAAPCFNRANALRDLGRYEPALQAYDSALVIAPRFYAAAVNRANLLAFLKRWEAADAAYQSAIALQPEAPDAWMNRGVARKSAGDSEGAARFLRQALELNPRYVEAAFNLGSILREMGQAGDAMATFDHALRVVPRHAKSAHGRALALRDLNRPNEALQAFEAALASDPTLIEAVIGRAALLNAHGRSRAALDGVDRALSERPGNAELWVARGHAPSDPNDSDGALASHREALRINSDLAPARFGATLAHLRILYRDGNEIERRRAAYAEALERLARWTAEAAPTDEVLAAAANNQPFFLAYQNNDNRALQQRYGALIRDLVVRRFADAPPPPRIAGEKLRIGIVSAFFRNHSNWKMPIKGWLEGLDRTKFALYGYHLGQQSDTVTEKAAGLCDRFVAGRRRPADWRSESLTDRPHALIYPGLMMDETSLLLAAQRLAPVQCNSWGHPETSGLPTLDYFLGSELMDASGAENFYTEKLVRLPGLSIVHTPPDAGAVVLRRADLGLRDDAFVFWSGQTLMKYLPQYDDIFARIAEAAPAVQFVFLSFPRAAEVTTFFRRRLARAFARRGLAFERHCVLVGPFSQPEFLGALNVCDALLDTPGWSACNSMLESHAAALPVVTMPGRFLRSRHGAAILAQYGDRRGVVDSTDAYVAEALRLMRDDDYRLSRREAIIAAGDGVAAARATVAGLERALTRMIEQSYCAKYPVTTAADFSPST